MRLCCFASDIFVHPQERPMKKIAMNPLDRNTPATEGKSAPRKAKPKSLATRETAMEHQTFTYNKKHTIRAIVLNGKQWFFATDIAKALGFKSWQYAVRKYCKTVRSTEIDINGVLQKVKIIGYKDVLNLSTNALDPPLGDLKFSSWFLNNF